MKDLPETENGDKIPVNEENEVERFTFSLLGKQALQFFNLEKGFLHTLKLLIINPGKHIRAYLSHDRNRLINPFKFYLFTGTIFVFIYRYLLSEEHFENRVDSELEQEVFLFIIHYYHFFLLFAVFFIAFFSYLLFKKESGYNLIEILIFNLYITGIFFAISIITSPLGDNFQPYSDIIISLISFSYFIFAYISFFRGDYLETTVKTVLAIILGICTIIFLIILSGFIVGFLQAVSQA
ncbi:DUF3667 domain-containing protein [Balneolales bacterium ANBcel1]|nr:DUF3667 domain-containing protein [Balneolales bacterium ANBcel1]